VVKERAGTALNVLMNHLPSSYQNSQCRRLTTLLLKPTGAAEGAFAGTFGWLSLSEYLPTRITSLPLGRVRDTGANFNDGRVARGSKKVLNRIEGSASRLPLPPSCRAMASPVVAERARVMSSVGGKVPRVPAIRAAASEPVRNGAGGVSLDGVAVAVPAWDLSFEDGVDSPSG